jgi:4-hydroxy-tetrahydrodipicolinate synthase
MNSIRFEGLLPAFITPVRADGTLDRDALHGLVDHQIVHGAGGLVALGGTGEATALTPALRIETVRETVAAAKGRVPVVAGVLSPGLGDAIEAGKAFVEAGAAGLMTIAPYYSRVDQAGVLAYFEAFYDAVRAPVLLYDNPARSRVVIAPETIATLAQKRAICGMKASSMDLYHFDQIMTRVDDRFDMLSGWDHLFAQQVALGARGGVLTSAVITPGFWNDVQRLVEAGEFKQAIAMQRKIYPLLEALFTEENPGPLRIALEMLGLPAGTPLLPLGDVSDALKARLRDVLDDAIAQKVIPFAA